MRLPACDPSALVRCAPLLATWVAVWVANSQGMAQGLEFNRDIRPILSDRCYQCHGPDKSHRKAGLRLDLRSSALALRKGRAAIVPGNPSGSALVARITAADPEDRTPPHESHKTLSPAEIARLIQWIGEGAEYQAHWSYELPKQRPLPAVRDTVWGAQPIDRWILSGLESAKLKPSPPADPITLLRRVTLDITGLPPTIQEVRAYLADAAPNRYQRLVERLLGSPRYGERMAMYWLDLVRFADTVGYHGDQEHAISPYRDYVIDAFANNKPFDEFTVEQLAGDLLPNSTQEQKIATGYNRLLQTSHEGGVQPKEYLAIYAADRVRNVAGVWLGATLGCAQCHDHKYDPYTARDFYSMAAFFADIQELGDFKGSPNRSPTTRPPEMVVLSSAAQQDLSKLDSKLAMAKRPATGSKASKDLIKSLGAQRTKVLASGRRTMITVSKPPRQTRLLHRGDWMDTTGEIVQPAVPHFLPQIQAKGRRANRLDLARWLISKAQPLTARVFVNRMWYLLFGRGLSVSLDDFGSQGAAPDHPELLDALASEFASEGWDVKNLVRRIVSSKAYQQRSIPDPQVIDRNPANRWFAWQSRWRLPAEMIRDNALAVSGLLVEQVGGDSVKPYQPAGYYRHLNFPPRKYRQHSDQRQWRRGVYMHWQRMFLHPALKAFDAPTREECTAKRSVSNTPQAALTLLNDPTFVEAARVFAAKLLTRSGSVQERLGYGFEMVTARPASAPELAVLVDTLSQHRKLYRASPKLAGALQATGLTKPPKGVNAVELASWTAVTRVLLNLHETTTRN
jgi:hypothetical protein